MNELSLKEAIRQIARLQQEKRDMMAALKSVRPSISMPSERTGEFRLSLLRQVDLLLSDSQSESDGDLNDSPCPKCGRRIGSHTQMDWERCLGVKTPDEDETPSTVGRPSEE